MPAMTASPHALTQRLPAHDAEPLPSCASPHGGYARAMLSILEVPLVRRQAAPISVATYHAMAAQGLVDKRTELLRGVIVEKMSKSPLHVFISRQLFRLAENAAVENLIVRQEAPLTLSDSEPEPDIAVAVGLEKDFRRAHPTGALLVMEVAVSSVEIDREKATIYAAAGVGEYWLVLPESATIEVHTAPRDGGYAERRVFTRTDTVVSQALPALRVNLGELFAE